MSAITFPHTVTLEKMQCKKCSGVFAIEQGKLEYARANAGGYTCPYCSTQWSWKETEDQKRVKDLERKLAWEAGECARQKQAREWTEQTLKNTQNSLRATKGVVTSMKTRISNSTCPCCNRHFPNDKLAKHLATKHPDFKEEPKTDTPPLPPATA